MNSASKYAFRAFILVVTAVIALAAVDSAIAAKPVQIETATQIDNVVTVTVTNPNKKASYVAVGARYLDENNLYVAKAYLLIAGKTSQSVELILATITDDINPLSIVEGPDPIMNKITVSAIMWSD